MTIAPISRRFLVAHTALFGGKFELAPWPIDAPFAGLSAIVGGADLARTATIAARANAAGIPFFNIGCAADSLRGADCLRTMFHIAPSDAMKADATAAANKAMIPVPGRPRGIQAAPDGKRVYVTSSDDQPNRESNIDGIVAIDVATRKIVAMYHIGTDPEQFAITPDGARVYASNEDGGTATSIDTRTGKYLATLVVGIEPEGVAVSPDGRYAVVMSETPDGRRLFVTAEVGGTVTDIDGRTFQTLKTIELEHTEGKPVGVAVSPDGKRVYVANGRASTVSVIDVTTDRVLFTIPVGKRPWGIVLVK